MFSAWTSVKVADLKERGMLFHSLGAATTKAQSPLSLHFVCGTNRRPKSANLRDLEVEYQGSPMLDSSGCTPKDSDSLQMLEYPACRVSTD